MSSQHPLKGHAALITGGAKGIGFAIARALAEVGCHVALCGRHAESLAKAAAELGEYGVNVAHFVTDVTREESVQQLFERLDAEFPPLDILVNNAGAFDGGHFPDLTVEAWKRVIDVCLTGTFLCSRSAFQRMASRKSGRILNIGSISAQRPRPGAAPYAAAKFGVWGLTQAIALDGREVGITCSCLHPGNVLVKRRQETQDTADREPMMSTGAIAAAALAMLSLPPDVNFLEAIVLPRDQAYLGRA